MTHRDYAMSFLFIARKEIIMKVTAVRFEDDGVICVLQNKSKRKILNSLSKKIKEYFKYEDYDFEVVITKITKETPLYETYMRNIK